MTPDRVPDGSAEHSAEPHRSPASPPAPGASGSRRHRSRGAARPAWAGCCLQATKLASLYSPRWRQDGFLVPDPAQPRTQVRLPPCAATGSRLPNHRQRRAARAPWPGCRRRSKPLWPAQRDEHVEQLAYHYSRSDDVEKAVEYLVKAGAARRELFLNSAAIGFFARRCAAWEIARPRGAAHAPRATILAAFGPGAAHCRRSFGRGQEPAAGL